MKKFLPPISATVLAVLMCCFTVGIRQTFAQSQASSGQVAGTVTDSNGAAIPNASVKVVNKDTGLERSATTSEDGIYSLVLLPPGNYDISAEATGFTAVTLPNVVVQVGRTTDAAITLGAGGVQEVVTVTAEAIQTTRSESDAVINQTAIETLPINGRRFQDFVTLTPTAQIDPQRGQISLSGQKGINSNINVDGVDYNQPFFGGIRGGERSNLAFTIPQESIKEFQVIASGYSAEFGRSSGGLVNAVTKSGGNSIRGSAFYLLRPSSLARGNEFTEALQEQNLTPRGVDATLAPTQHQFGGSIGGPIIKNKLFYFGAYEQQIFNADRVIIFGIPSNFPTAGLSPAQLDVLNFYNSQQQGYELTNDAWAGLGRIDWTINGSNQLNARFNMSKNDAENAVSRGETSLDPTTTQALSTNGTEQNENKIFVAQVVSTFGVSSVNELRFQWAREDRPRLSNSEIPQILTSFGTIGATAFLPTTQFDRRIQFADSFTYIKGNHNAKFGGEFSNLYANQRFGFNQFGQYVLSQGSTNANIAATLAGLSNVPSGNFLGRFDLPLGTGTLRYLKQIGNLEADFNVQELAFFAQDNWRITPKLSINYGLRVEQQYNPTPDTSNTQILNIVQNTNFPVRGTGFNPSDIPDSGWQWGPRLGFAFDPNGDGKTVIRGSGGLYYARTPLLVLADSTNNYRLPPANVSTQLPFSGFSQTAFNTFLGTAAGQAYRNITGCNPTVVPLPASCVPNTLYRQFAVAGINLNSFPLDGLPIITTEQIAGVAGALGLNPNPFTGAQVTGHAEDFKNPRSWQLGFAVEREVGENFSIGADYAHIHTDRIQRNRDLNLPTRLTAGQYIDFLRTSNSAATFNAMVASGLIGQIEQAGRTYIAITQPGGHVFPTGAVTTRLRPTQVQQGFALGAVQVRESTAKSTYDALTLRARLTRSWGQLNAFYTLSRSLGDDDNERDAGGVAYMDAYDLSGEFHYSRLDRRHQFVANPIFLLPWDFEVSSAIRLRSATPLNSTVGADLNGDTVNNDRPLAGPGNIIKRNRFRNRAIYDIDARVQKSFRFDENKRLIISSEFFNVLNLSNVIFPTPNTATSSGLLAQFCTPATVLCGLNGTTNPNFLQIRDSSTGALLVNNTNPGSQVFQMQIGVRFQF
jgi:hypothetical protein